MLWNKDEKEHDGPHVPSVGHQGALDLLREMLVFNPRRRCTVERALAHVPRGLLLAKAGRIAQVIVYLQAPEAGGCTSSAIQANLKAGCIVPSARRLQRSAGSGSQGLILWRLSHGT